MSKISEINVEIKTNAPEVIEQMNELKNIIEEIINLQEKARELNRNMGLPNIEILAEALHPEEEAIK